MNRLKKTVLFLILAVCLCMTGGCGGGARKTENMRLDTIYRIGLSSYLKEKIPFREYEEKIDSIDGCRQVEAGKRKSAHLHDRTGTKYFYIRNEIHTERLSPEDIEILKSAELDSSGSLSQEAMDVIERTFPLVISAQTDGGDEVIYDGHLYGGTDEVTVPADALVINIAVQACAEDRDAAEKELYGISKQMETEVSDSLGNGTPVCIRMDLVTTG